MRVVWFGSHANSDLKQIDVIFPSAGAAVGWYGSGKAASCARNLPLWPALQGGVEWSDEGGGGEKYYIHSSLAQHHSIFQTDCRTLRSDKSSLIILIFFSFYTLHFFYIFLKDSDMAKGEGGEQYSNASLLNKQPSSDDIKLTKKVGSFILFLRTIVSLCDGFRKQKQAEKEAFC